ncbi:MAG: S8 family serine peptidase, partial [Ferruginibacter sp.]
MRRIYSFLLIVFFTLPVLAQNGSVPFYYFGTQKIALQQSDERIFVQLKNELAATAVQDQLKAQFNLPNRVFSKLYEKQNWVIHLDQPVLKAKQKDILRYLQSNTAVAYCQTALKSAEGKDLICANAFYVKLKSSTTYSTFTQFALRNQCTIVQAYPYDPSVFLLEATLAQSHVGILKANAFFESGLFEYAEPDFAGFDLIESVPPNDPFYNLQWNHINNTNTQAYNGIPGADIDVDLAWTITQGNSNIRIAVIDVGVQRNHPDLINNIDPLGYGLASGNTTTGDIIDTANYHGTACAGIIAATANNNIGIAGIAPLCKIIPVNIARNSTGAFGTFSQIAGAIDWAWNQGAADVLSNSWGGGTPSSLYRDAIKRAITNGRGGKGAVVVFASGNLNAGVSSPAIFPETIAVGAMTMCYERKSPATCDGETTWGSNFGAGLDVVAPGVKIITTGINGTGTGTYAGYLTGFNGTSAACPMVAGVAALMLSVNSTLTQTSVREIIERTSRKVGNYTYSRAAAQPNGSWNNEMGHGLVNAYQAIQAAQSNATYCTVSITANGNTRICSGANVTLQVASPISGATYQWRKDGATASSGTSIVATTAGNYDVLLTTTNGCKDTSSVIAVSVGLPEGTLRVDAGRDTVVCQNSTTILGGGPAASGGTPFIQAQRGLAYSVSENAFYRFDPNQPSLSFKQIKTSFYSGANSNTLICGSAATPFGLYMLVRNTNQFIKVDTT